jgi:hypothetical protein
VKWLSSAIFTLVLLPGVVLIAWADLPPVHVATTACLVGTLASPEDEQSYSADYYTMQQAVLPGSHVSIFLAAYGPPGTGQPTVSNVAVLN